ncbi:MAG: hypothetical protein K940chlam9_01331 [Chlamydiae bacterium]|nr:hypothetical protein [Chlamydiota bacterium]
MQPFENLIRELGKVMGIELRPDSHQSCLIEFPQNEISIQIDLDFNADQILVGATLGRLTPGVFREQIFQQALLANGTGKTPRGTLAYSEKNDELILFQFLPLAFLTGEKFSEFLQLFLAHAIAWKKAIANGTIPQIEEESSQKSSGMFGLKP